MSLLERENEMTKRYKVAALASVTLAVGVPLALSRYWLPAHPFSLISTKVSEAPFSITNIKEGQRLSGNISVLVYVTGKITWVEFAIDGQTYSYRNTNTYGRDHQAAFDVPTYLFKNGPHTLQI